MTTIEYARQFILKAQKLQNEHANETIIRDNFTSYLRNMFPENTKWVNYHIEGAETHIHLVRNNRPVSGFIDNCIDSTAIEYEKDLKELLKLKKKSDDFNQKLQDSLAKFD